MRGFSMIANSFRIGGHKHTDPSLSSPMSTCGSHAAYPPGFYNSDVAERIVVQHDLRFQCPSLLDEPISSTDSRTVLECLADDACDASKYDTNILDRVVVCSTAYENLTNANCNGNDQCEKNKSHIRAAYDGRESSMEQMSQQRRDVTFDEWTPYPSTTGSPIRPSDTTPLYITPGADLCGPTNDVGLGSAPAENVSLETIVPWHGPGNVNLRDFDKASGGPGPPIGNARGSAEAVITYGPLMISDNITAKDYPSFSVIRVQPITKG